MPKRPRHPDQLTLMRRLRGAPIKPARIFRDRRRDAQRRACRIHHRPEE